MQLVPITADYGIELDIVYATPANFTGKVVYARPLCYLNEEAASGLRKAISAAQAQGLRIRLWDGYRPQEAQERLWAAKPDPEFIADPRTGSNHTRGAAIDLTLIGRDGNDLDMGTGFDDFRPLAHHGDPGVSTVAQVNRAVLLGIMQAAGFEPYTNEWWHYQLPNPGRYPLLRDGAGCPPMM